MCDRLKSMSLCQFNELCDECCLFCDKSPDLFVHIVREEERSVDTRGVELESLTSLGALFPLPYLFPTPKRPPRVQEEPDSIPLPLSGLSARKTPG